MVTSTKTDGDRLKLLLRSQGRSSKWLAEQIGMDKTSLSKAIAGEPSRGLSPVDQVVIARILGVPVTWIFQDESQ